MYHIFYCDGIAVIILLVLVFNGIHWVTVPVEVVCGQATDIKISVRKRKAKKGKEKGMSAC